MTIIIYFHLSAYRNFKAYYTKYVSTVLRPYFPELVSYTRFVELMYEAFVPLLLYMTKFRNGKCTGISFINTFTSINEKLAILIYKLFIINLKFYRYF
jgi:hypothetical protein